MASFIFNNSKYKILQGKINFESDFSIVLVNNVLSQNSKIFTEITAPGYQKKTLPLKLEKDTTNNRVRVVTKVKNITWTDSNISASGAIILDPTGEMFFYINFGKPQTSSNGKFTINFKNQVFSL